MLIIITVVLLTKIFPNLNSSIVIPPVLPECAIVAFVGGYVLHILTEWNFCPECVARLQQEKCMSPQFIYIRSIGMQFTTNNYKK